MKYFFFLLKKKITFKILVKHTLWFYCIQNYIYVTPFIVSIVFYSEPQQELKNTEDILKHMKSPQKVLNTGPNIYGKYITKIQFNRNMKHI